MQSSCRWLTIPFCRPSQALQISYSLPKFVSGQLKIERYVVLTHSLEDDDEHLSYRIGLVLWTQHHKHRIITCRFSTRPTCKLDYIGALPRPYFSSAFDR